MRRFRDAWRKAVAVLALICAGAATSASAPVGAGWAPDSDEQFMLDVNIRHLPLSQGVRAYQTPEGTCLVFGDFLQALDVPMKIDLQAHRASGWAFKSDNVIDIDAGKGVATVRGKSESFATSAIREVPEGWCIDSASLSKWFALDLKAETASSSLSVESATKLPVELALERRNRSSSLKRDAALDLDSLPHVRLPYRMWRAPAFEFIVNGGITYGAKTGVKIDRSASIYAAGELATLSYSASIQSGLGTGGQTVRATLYRSDPEGELLGSAHATHFAIGDVAGLASEFGGGTQSGRGVMITNQPLTHAATFDHTQFSGELPPGWDAELYRNSALLAFAAASSDGKYHFENIDMLYGDNEFDIVLYGPQGQIEHHRQVLNVGRENTPPGKLWYWAGVRQPGIDLVTLNRGSSGSVTSGLSPPGLSPPGRAPTLASVTKSPELTLDARYGIDKQMSVGALIRSTMIQDERVTFVEGSVRRAIGSALIEIAGAVDLKGKMAGRAQIVAKIGAINLSAASFFTNGFGVVGQRAVKSEHRLGISTPLRLGAIAIPLGADVRLVNRLDGSRAIDASARLGAQIGRFNLSSETRYTREMGGVSLDGGPPGRSEKLDTQLIASARIGKVRFRGSGKFDVKPVSRFRSAEVDAYWSAGEHADWEAGAAYDADSRRIRGRASYIRRFSTVGVALTGEVASDGAVAAGISLNFSLDPFRGNFRPTSEKLASSGAVKARVFEDLNENGRFDEGEPVEVKALITAGMRASDRETNKLGEVTLGSLAPYVPLAIGIDQTSLDNPALTPAKAAQVIIPRPGVPAIVDIALVGGGSLEGIAVHDDHREFEGLDIELADEAGQVISTTRTDLDGYFLFERVRYGTYHLRLSADSAAAVHADRNIGEPATVSRDHPLQRVGMVVVRTVTQVASAQ